ncbi:hypothetical protein [Scytonema sp. PCC 10023]|uniref:hypothetical protein n=1 Tax=Scytonema sp. PCC 10023 TaxID=1680591 RepID=UPI0039C6B7CB
MDLSNTVLYYPAPRPQGAIALYNLSATTIRSSSDGQSRFRRALARKCDSEALLLSADRSGDED